MRDGADSVGEDASPRFRENQRRSVMADVTSRFCIKGLAAELAVMRRAVAIRLGRFSRWIERPDKYRPERHYMRGSGPKSRGKANRD